MRATCLKRELRRGCKTNNSLLYTLSIQNYVVATCRRWQKNRTHTHHHTHTQTHTHTHQKGKKAKTKQEKEESIKEEDIYQQQQQLNVNLLPACSENKFKSCIGAFPYFLKKKLRKINFCEIFVTFLRWILHGKMRFSTFLGRVLGFRFLKYAFVTTIQPKMQKQRKQNNY